MATFTNRLLLRKPDPNPATGDNVNVATDINDSMDKLDAAVGFMICTSATRPTGAERWNGRGILETDTKKAYVWDQATATWLQLLLGSAQFDQAVRAVKIGLGVAADAAAARLLQTLGAGGGATSQMLLATSGPATGNRAISLRGSGDTQDHYILDFDGNMQWGSGTAGTDTNLYRSAPNVLRTDDSLDVGNNLTVAGSATVDGRDLMRAPVAQFTAGPVLATTTEGTILTANWNAVAGDNIIVAVTGQAQSNGDNRQMTVRLKEGGVTIATRTVGSPPTAQRSFPFHASRVRLNLTGGTKTYTVTIQMDTFTGNALDTELSIIPCGGS